MGQNLLVTALNNALGIALAALGVLPPVWAAAAQSLPDMGIMLNSARLLRAPGRSTGKVAERRALLTSPSPAAD